MMTFEDLYWMLSKGRTPAEIKEKLFSSASDDIGRSFYSRCGMSFGNMSDVLMQNGYDFVDSMILYFPDTTREVPLSQIDCNKFIESIRQADEMHPEILQVWESFEKEIRKFQKIREISENSIDAIVRERLRSTGIEYNLTLEPTDALLKVKMKRGRYFEIRLPLN